MPRADLTPVLEKAAADLKKRLTRAVDPLKDAIGGIDEPNRQALRNALVGSLVGGAGGAAYGARSSDDNRVAGAIRGLLAGAALGGTAGGAGTAGINMLTGKTKFPGEKKRSLNPFAAGTQGLGETIIGHPLTAGGAGLGGYLAYRHGPSASNLMSIMGRSTNKTERQIYDSMLAAEKDNPGLTRSDLWRAVTHSVAKMTGAGKQIVRKSVLGLSGKPGVPPQRPVRTAARGVSQELSQLRAKSLAQRLAKLMPGTKVPTKAWWALAPVGLASGYLADKYIKGDY